MQTEYVDRSNRLKAINPLLHFCTALGLLPVKVKVTKTDHGNNTVASKRKVIVSCVNVNVRAHYMYLFIL